MPPRTVLLIGVPAVLLAAHTALWIWATGQLRTGLDAQVARFRSDGWTADHGDVARAGWPFAASLVVSAPSLSASGGAAWRADRLVLRVPLADPGVLSILPEGAQTLRFGDSPTAEVTARELSADVPLAGPGPARLLARDLRAVAAGEAATVGLLTGHVVATGGAGRFSLSAEAVALPEDIRWALGPHVSSATADGDVTAVLADGPRAWRDAGGALEVTHLAVGWGPLGASGTLHLDLDEALQPQGSAELQLVGAPAALDAAAGAGVITPQAATAAKAVAALLQGASDSGGRLAMPFSLRDRTLSAAGVPLARLPAVAWPSP